MDAKDFIAKRVAMELKDGDLVNLGIGLPTLVANFLPKNAEILFQSENGMVGLGPVPAEDKICYEITNAGGQPVSILTGGAFFDSAMSFSIIRGGHVDATVLGALQVDEKGNLANWMVPGQMVPGMGGAMDLVTGAKKVIIAMTHTAKGDKKIMKECNLPLTAKAQVNMIITEMAVIEVTPEGLVVREIAPDVTKEALIEATDATLIFDPNMKVIDIQ